MNPCHLAMRSPTGRSVLILGVLALAVPDASHAQGTSPPVIIKAFGRASIPLNGSTSLTFTIQNNNTTTALTGVGFSDALPAGLVVSTPNGLTGACGGGTITATQGTNGVSLSGASLTASSSCTFSVNVTGVAVGQQDNTTGNVTSVEGGAGGTASASITVLAPPSIAAVFSPSAIGLNATTSLTFTITNPAANPQSLTGVAFTNALPTGLTVATAAATICGGTVTTTAPSGISLSGATIARNSQCQFAVTVTGTAAGSYADTTGNVTSTNGGTGNQASASVSVAAPPTITKSFGAASIPLNGTTSVTFDLTNPNTHVALSGLAFIDNLPAGMVVASTPNLSTSCGGTATATAGASSITLAGGTLAAGAACSVSVTVQGTTSGVKNNSVQVSASTAGVGNTSSASLTVMGPPVIIKAFGTAVIALNGSTSLTFTIQNNNTTTTLTGVGFMDMLPAGLVVSTPNGLTGTCGGGTVTATQGTNVVSLNGASLAASTSCTFSVNVTGVTTGQQDNTTGKVSSVEGGTGGTASASVSVLAPPSIAVAFNPAAIALDATTSLTFTITNPAANHLSLRGVAFTDNLPAGLLVATPNGLANACGGTVTATAGSGSISLTGGTIANNSTCTISVAVTSSAFGSYVNTTGAVSSTNGGTGNTATATLTVQPADLAIAKTHVGTFYAGQVGAAWTITASNVGAGPTTGTVTVTDTLPDIPNPPVPTALSGTGWTCTLNALACSRGDALAPGAAYPDITLTVSIPSGIQPAFTNRAAVSGGGETNAANDTVSDPTSLSPPDFTLAIVPDTAAVVAGQSALLSVIVTPKNGAFTNPVALTVSGLPSNASAVFTPASVTPSANPATSSLRIVTAAHAPLAAPDNRGNRPLFLVLLLFSSGLFFAAIRFHERRSGKRRLLTACALAGIAIGLYGCRSSSDVTTPATPPGTYALTITATSDTLEHSAPATLIVQP